LLDCDRFFCLDLSCIADERYPRLEPQFDEGENEMTKVQIYDKAMCCSTGICGPQVDPVLPKFSADLDWLKDQGHDVVRFNLAQDPAEFAKNPTVQKMLADDGVECLPLVIVDDHVVSRTEYPSRENLAMWTGTSMKPKATLPMASDSGCCGGNTGCC
jgi:hypothetical protein